MKRIASVIGLSVEGREEYETLHANVWPEVLIRMRASNITNYSIFRHDELLFSYMEYIGENLEADLGRMAADPITQAWWKLCAPLQRPLGDRPTVEWWTILPEVFHLD